MHAAQESQLKKVGIIAGSGRPPVLLAEKLEAAGIVPYIVAIDGVADASAYQARQHAVIPLGMAGSILAWFKTNGVTDIVLTGALKRPEWSKLKVDARGMMIIAKVALKRLGDDSLLRAIRKEIEADGLRLRGIHEFVPDLLMPAGLLTKTAPKPQDWPSIRLGFNVSQDLGRQDKGQSVIVQNETILGLEGKDGTNALMETAAEIKQAIGRSPILVKTCKPQQDRSLDLPSLGPRTIELAASLGFAGIALQAEESLLIDRETVIELCNAHGLFLYGIKEGDPLMGGDPS